MAGNCCQWRWWRPAAAEPPCKFQRAARGATRARARRQSALGDWASASDQEVSRTRARATWLKPLRNLGGLGACFGAQPADLFQLGARAPQGRRAGADGGDDNLSRSPGHHLSYWPGERGQQ